MKKLTLLGLVATLATSTAMAADTIKSQNDTPVFLKLDAGMAIPASSKSKSAADVKLKNKSSSAALNFTVGYNITDDFSVDFELGFIPRFKKTGRKTSPLNQQLGNKFLPGILLNRALGYGLTLQGIQSLWDDIIPDINLVNNLPASTVTQAMNFVNAVNAGNANAGQFSEVSKLLMPTWKNQVTTSSNDKLSIVTGMIGGNYNLYKDDQFKVYVGAQVGMARKTYKSVNKISVTWGDPSRVGANQCRTVDYTFRGTKKSTSPVYGLRIGGEMALDNNITLNVAYNFKDFGKTKRPNFKIGNTTIKSKSTHDRAHIITAGISYSL